MPTYIVRASDRTPETELSSEHPLNPRSEIHGFALSRMAGLQRVGVWYVRLPPGKESFIYHRHHLEEEFMYVLAGRAIVEIDDAEHEVGAGDFVAFPCGTAHHVRNEFEEDVHYLSGGERRDAEIADYPKLGKRLLRVGSRAELLPLEGEGLPGADKL